jgi:hypothetical protein
MVRPIAGFPTSWGNKKATVMRVTGPSSYTQYTAPSTGGQDVKLQPTGGVKFADFAIGSVSDDGTHRVEVVQIEPSSVGGITVPKTQLVLKWYVVATGSEAAGAADLDGQTVSILVVGDN